jgi:hypothetical protein
MRGHDFLEVAKNLIKSQFEASIRSAAELAIGLLAEFNKEPLRSQIRSNIREYERKLGTHS